MHLPRASLSFLIPLALISAGTAGQEQASSGPSAQQIRQLADQAQQSLVIIKYVWEGEANRQELEGVGVVVSEDGVVIAPLDLVPVVLPDSQVKDFKILIPRRDGDPREIKARLLARDERTNLIFVKADPEADAEGEAATKPADTGPVSWKPVQFSYQRPQVGEWVVSVGRLPETAGYSPYVYASRMAANLRGPVPLCVVDNAVTSSGSVVLDAGGKAVGLVERIGRRSPFLTGVDSMETLQDRLTIFVPVEFYRLSLEDPPTDSESLKIPYLGTERLTGLSKELREYYELGDRPAVQVGDIIAGSPAQAAGVQSGDVIIALNGEPLERGDMADEQPDILERTINRTKVGQELTLTLLDASKEQRDVKATLAERPMQMRQAQRWYAEDLGFSTRELVFADRYFRNLPLDTPGVAVAFIKEQSAAAAAGLRVNDLVRKLNQNDVQALADFREAYEKFRQSNPNDPVVMEVMRGGETSIVRIEPPR